MLSSKEKRELIALEKEKLRRKCIKSFHEFVKAAWHIIEPKVPFVDGWHIKAICQHLEATHYGKIHNLVINMPPRNCKSTLTCVLFPAWVWITKPEKKFIYSSYALNLSKRDSIKCRSLIQSVWYRNLFNPDWSLKHDQNEKLRFDNTYQGFRIATSVGGVGTGEGADYVLCDDAMKASDASSETIRENVIEWWDQEMSTRNNDTKTAVKIIIMQRLHEKDLAGHVIEAGNYEHLILPAEYEGNKNRTSIGWEDPRNEIGELLWPQKFDRKAIDDLKKTLGSYGSAAQLQQRPTPRGGGLFKRIWWQRYREFPITKRIIQVWDTASKVGLSNDFSVCATWGETENGFYLLDLWKSKCEMPQLLDACQSLYIKWNPNAVVIEDKASGIALIQTLRQKTTMPIIAYDPKMRDKQIRASNVTPIVEAKKCFLPIEGWAEDFILEHELFPNSAHDDMVDTTSCALEYLTKNSISNNGPRVRRL